MLASVIRARLRREQDNWRTLTAAAIGVAALLAGLVALAIRTFATSWQPSIVLAAFAHDLMWAIPVAAVLFAIARRWYVLGATLVALVLAVLSQASLYNGAAWPTSGTTLTVMQANLHIGTADPASVVRDVTEHHVDLLMTEELTPAERDRLLDAGLAAALPHQFAVPSDGGSGLAIWSRFPMTGRTRHPGFDQGVLTATMHVSRTVSTTVVAMHLPAPYPKGSGEWSAEIKRLHVVLQQAARGNDPVIAAGDLNATTDHAQLRTLLTGGYHDAVEQSGAGYLSTYPADRWYPPLIAIDHVLTSGATATNARTVKLPGSDHRGLLVKIRIDG
jgi:endonuclease/exonuclease/phosphatase (EEP) superfamily protein YafD